MVFLKISLLTARGNRSKQFHSPLPKSARSALDRNGNAWVPRLLASRFFAACLLAITGCVHGAGADEGQLEQRSLEEPPASNLPRPQPSLRAVSTFESISVYWKPNDSKITHDCQVRFRAEGSTNWKQGYPLWYDGRRGVCKGSIVHLDPDTLYEVETYRENTLDSARTLVRTWREDFPIAEVVYLPEYSTETLTIERSGSPGGFILYTSEPGKSATIDVAGVAASNVTVSASHVIIRGLILKNAARNAIELGADIHDVVLENNDVSGWGRIHPDGWGYPDDAAIASVKDNNSSITRLIIQRNRLHHPRSDSNAWDEYREYKNTHHPLGPYGIFLWNTLGNHVIRYNEITSDEDHKFQDCIGGGNDFSDRGFPNSDSDIYGNLISGCWDDAIEAEGANKNVRIWGNYLDLSFVMIATAPTHDGPLYIWRNVTNRSRKTALLTMEKSKRGTFVKSQSKSVRSGDEARFFGGGRIYIFHNTTLQDDDQGVTSGPSDMGSLMLNLMTRNNIFQVNADFRDSIADRNRILLNDFDYDLYNGRIVAAPGQEPNGIQDTPYYERSHKSPEYALSHSSPGYDAGEFLPNFSDEFMDGGPDMGAQEASSPSLEFGVDAYQQ